MTYRLSFIAAFLLTLLGLLLLFSASPAATLPSPQIFSLNKALWGTDVPNTVKNLPMGYDETGGRLYTGGIAEPYLLVIDPTKGHPDAAIDLETSMSGVANVLIDGARQKLIWINRQSETVRVIDLKTRKVIAKVDGQIPQGDKYPVKDAVYDAKTGLAWVVNSAAASVKAYGLDASVVKTIAGLKHPMSLSLNGDATSLYILDAPSMQLGALYRYDLAKSELKELRRFEGEGRPPRHIHFTADGKLLLVKELEVTALDAVTLAEKWRTTLADAPAEITDCGGESAFLLKEAGIKNQDALSEVAFLEPATGRLIATTKVRYEASWLACDGPNRRLFVSNGGDGSVSEITLASHSVTATLDAGNAAEEVDVDSKSGARIIRNRLGGSALYVWKSGSDTLTPLTDTKWPLEVFMDSDRRRIHAVSHYESKVFSWDADTLDPLASLSLGVANNYTDTLGDGDYDVAGGIAGFVFPETGAAAAVDLANGKVLWSKTVAELKIGGEKGPGNAFAGVDVARNRFYAHIAAKGLIIAYDLKTGAETSRITLAASSQQLTLNSNPRQRGPRQGPPFGGQKPPLQGNRPPFGGNKPPLQNGQKPPLVNGQKPPLGNGNRQFGNKRPPQGERQGQGGGKFGINTFYVDRVGGRLFAGASVVDAATLKAVQTLSGVEKIFHVDETRILGMHLAGQTEVLVELDSKTYAIRKSFDLIQTSKMRAEPTYDAVNKKLYLADLAKARVLVYDY